MTSWAKNAAGSTGGWASRLTASRSAADSQSSWRIRAIGMTAVHVVVRVLLGFAIVQWPLQGVVSRTIGFVVVIAVAAWWGVRDARSEPELQDDESAPVATIVWLKAAVVTGFASGLLCWLVTLIPGVLATQNGLFFELTSGAAFTILAVFLPAVAAGGLTRLLLRLKSRSGTDDNRTAAAPADHDDSTGYDSDDAATSVIPRVEDPRDARTDDSGWSAPR
ncbi:hypothetical protein DW322_13660 [Rhodococcus rhodnii]|uniref:Transmembrane protein n=2 Tax=Rhodococcus rhodnii TaxID=38312 RepID=R7WKU2_9NOCA|nr:B-4DMT family transporter [Rhodococcus rhodnii]EOM75917.1 hypothetical protein Rrhod_2829 [Rhodococcus rhodnii LMG 5362]TXG91077.1 hypothetical protein DW322_13660 [Rhodococcus rhodnii]